MLPVGATLRGNLTVEAHLASGGFGNTYRVSDAFGQKFALKEFFMAGVTERRRDDHRTVDVSNTQNLDLYNEQLDKFRREAIRLHSLRHPNIVRVHDLFVENDTAYYLMDLIDGESLAKRVKREGRLPEAEVESYFRQILDALEEVHNRKLWHLDVKPANIMVDSAGKAVLIDFGSSKQMRQGGGATTGSLPSFTPGYAPTEQQDQNAAMIGAWTDLYALGATLYNLLTGNKPPLFSELAMKGSGAFNFVGLSSRWAKLIEWMMQLSPTGRPQSVAEVRQALEPLAPPTIMPEPPQPPTPSHYSDYSDYSDRSGLPEKRGSRALLIGIAAAVLLAVVGGVIALVAGRDKGYDDEEEIPGISATSSGNQVTDAYMTLSNGWMGRYTGPLDKENRPQGNGEMRFDNGCFYRGPFAKGAMDGDGAYFRNVVDGKLEGEFEGEFRDNEFYKGRYTYSEDGSSFDGYFENGKMSRGKLYDPNGILIETYSN